MAIAFTKVNALVFIQDGGRWKYQSLGVPVSGVMDDDAFVKGNLLVGNLANEACFEIGTGSLELMFAEERLISITGSGHLVSIDSIEAACYKPTLVQAGAKLSFKPSKNGSWSYLSIGGGLDISEVLLSKSTNLQSGFGGFEGRAFKKGDSVKIKNRLSTMTDSMINSLKKDNGFCKWSLPKIYKSENPIRVLVGPEWKLLSKSDQAKFLNQEYTVSSDSNRMGYRLNGKPISKKVASEMISSGVAKGTIQLTNDGSLIALMADSQTVGGYPRIAQVASVDIVVLAQRRPSDVVRFELISLQEAEQLFLERYQDYQIMKAGIRLLYL